MSVFTSTVLFSLLTLEVYNCDISSFFFFEIALVVWGLLWFHTNSRIVCSSSVKNAVGILIEIIINV